METPRHPANAQPQIRFIGDESVVAEGGVGDPVVTQAFVAFHRSTGRSSASRRGSSGFVSRSGLALAVLAFLGFGGGLSLAFFSFNGAEGSSSAFAARPPEMIYGAPPVALPVTEAAAAQTYAASGEAGLFATARFELRGDDQPLNADSIWQDGGGATAPAFDLLAASHTGSVPMFAATANQIPGSNAVDESGAAITGGFSALTTAPAPVPEPSTWVTMLTGAGLLVFVTRLKRACGAVAPRLGDAQNAACHPARRN